jgi:serine/threonine protein kinase
MPSPAGKPVEFAGTSRFKIRRKLGAGGMGVVYEAFDRERNENVALKTLRNLSADGILRFKNEFHAIADLHHPNLVNLFELISEDGIWFFTMELLKGRELLQSVRPSMVSTEALAETISATPTPSSQVPGGEPIDDRSATPIEVPALTARFDEERLRNCLGQLARALIVLHARQKVHRDIKPSNILVTDEGRLVLLDFGLITDALRQEWWSDLTTVGTCAYMAPEQAAAKPVGPEADWYSMGAVLYECLTGRVPHTGSALQILMDKQRFEPPPPSKLLPGVPADLDSLCADLLRFDPAKRPTGRQVLRRLGVRELSSQLGLPSTTTGAEGQPFLGRDAELKQLQEAFTRSQTEAVAVLVEGESGMGKSVLVRRFTESLDSTTVVLSGRCYERETVPYKAFDGVIDSLCRFLRGQSKQATLGLLPDNAALLAQVFPVLRRVEAVAEAPRPQHEVLDRQELRGRVFAALRELLMLLARRHPLVISIDDLQWADADSLVLLAELLRPPGAPRILLIATTRPVSEATRDMSRAIPGELRRIAIDRLPPDQAVHLARMLMERVAPDRLDVAAEIAREAGGIPLFIDELVRHMLETSDERGGRLQLEEALWRRVSRLEPTALQLLRLVAVAGAPLAQSAATEALQVGATDFSRAASLLRVANLVRTSGVRGDDTIESYHDRVRAAVVGNVDASTRQQCHRRLAVALETSARGDPESLMIHYEGAGDRKKAVIYAERAAAQATDALAFDRAARLYRRTLELRGTDDEETRALRVKLGDALGNAGRGAEAAEAYLSAAARSNAADRLEMQRRAAEQLFRSGHIDEGMAAVRTVLSAVDMKLPPTPRRALLSLLMQRARLNLRGLRFGERDDSQVSQKDLTRIDVCWSIALGLGLVDTIQGADFQTRGMLLALDAGEPYRIARAMAMEAAYNATGGGKTSARTRRLLDAAEELSERIGHPHAQALSKLMSGFAGLLEGRFAFCRDQLLVSEDILRNRCTGVAWELDSLQFFKMGSLAYLGEFAELARLAPIHLHEAQERGDLYCATNLRSGWSNLIYLAADDPEGGRRSTQEAMRSWSQRGFHIQHLYDVMAHGHIDLYLGDGRSALARLDESWKALEGSLLLRVQQLRVQILGLRGRAALAAALADPSAAPQLLKIAERDARKIEKEKMEWGSAFSLLLRAGVAHLRGQKDEALGHLRAAATAAERCKMGLHLAAARWREAQLLGPGAASRALKDAADAYMTAQNIRNPPRMVAMQAPGFAEE